MPHSEDAIKRARRLEAALNQLVKIGWIEAFVTHDTLNTTTVKWTPKGLERAKQIIDIVTEFHGGPDDLMALAVICRAHYPNGQNERLR